MKGTLIVALPVCARAIMHEKSWKTHTDVTVKCQENTQINERFKIKRDKENYFSNSNSSTFEPPVTSKTFHITVYVFHTCFSTIIIILVIVKLKTSILVLL